MSTARLSQRGKEGNAEAQWRRMYSWGAVAAIIALTGTVLDVILGSVTGGNLSALPQTAVDRFAQLQASPLLGLYNLDLLNTVTTLIWIPAYLALYAAQRRASGAYALLALIVFLVGTAIFTTNNSALPMLELSAKYASAATESQKALFAAAGEAMLARGAHGSLGVFIGFLLPIIASLIMSLAMLEGKVFTRATAYVGITGSTFMLLYIILVTFAPTIKGMATAFAMPGGLLMIAWMILFARRLAQLARQEG